MRSLLLRRLIISIMVLLTISKKLPSSSISKHQSFSTFTTAFVIPAATSLSAVVVSQPREKKTRGCVNYRAASLHQQHDEGVSSSSLTTTAMTAKNNDEDDNSTATVVEQKKQQRQQERSSSLSMAASRDEILRIAIKAAKKAGNIITLEGGGEGGAGVEVARLKANDRDLLTLVDPLCEKIIQETVLEAFPKNHLFLGEEDIPPGKEASAIAIDEKLKNISNDDCNWLWIVDPIDGTTNFVHGIPMSSVSIAVADHLGDVVVGVIYDPHRDELFTATKGGGSFLNGKQILVGSETKKLGEAVVAMGSPPGEESLGMSLLGVKALMPKVRTIRMIGSAAIMLAWIAANGRLTAYWEYDLSSWDVAAGGLIVTEAGGKFTDLEGEDCTLRTRKICASNGENGVHDAILNLLKDAGVA